MIRKSWMWQLLFACLHLRVFQGSAGLELQILMISCDA